MFTLNSLRPPEKTQYFRFHPGEKAIDKLIGTDSYNKVVVLEYPTEEIIKFFLDDTLVKQIRVTYDLEGGYVLESSFGDFLLLESGFFLLQEDGSKIII